MPGPAYKLAFSPMLDGTTVARYSVRMLKLPLLAACRGAISTRVADVKAVSPSWTVRDNKVAWNFLNSTEAQTAASMVFDGFRFDQLAEQAMGGEPGPVPDFGGDSAEDVLAQPRGSNRLYFDLLFISREQAETFLARGKRPLTTHGSVRMYLAGPEAQRAVQLRWGQPVSTTTVQTEAAPPSSAAAPSPPQRRADGRAASRPVADVMAEIRSKAIRQIGGISKITGGARRQSSWSTPFSRRGGRN